MTIVIVKIISRKYNNPLIQIKINYFKEEISLTTTLVKIIIL